MIKEERVSEIEGTEKTTEVIEKTNREKRTSVRTGIGGTGIGIGIETTDLATEMIVKKTEEIEIMAGVGIRKKIATIVEIGRGTVIDTEAAVGTIS